MRHLHLAFLLSFAAAGCTSEASEAPAPTSRPAAAGAEVLAENLDAAGAAALLARDPSVTVLDVRTPAEYEAGHLEDAVLLDFRAPDFAERLAELDRDVKYLVHCRSGGRSSSAFAQMKELGFRSIYHLDGGMLAWEKAELPVVK